MLVFLCRGIFPNPNVRSQGLRSAPWPRRGEMPRVRNTQSLAICASLIFLVRLLFIVFLGPTEAPQYADTSVYYSTSKKLATSGQNWIRPGSEFGYRAPLYFVYLAGIYSVSPRLGYRAGQIATSVLAVIVCLIIFRLTDMLEGRSAGWIALALRAFLPFFVVADTFVMSEPLFAVLLMAALFVFLSLKRGADWKHATLLGALIGLCLLTRESATLYPLIFGGGILLLGGAFRFKIVNLLLFSLALVIGLAPWMWRNEIVWGSPLPISQTAGINLYMGNNPDATGTWSAFRTVAPPGIRIGTPQGNSWYGQQAIRFIADHPCRFVVNGLKKTAWLLFPSFSRDEMTHICRAPPNLVSALSLLCGSASGLLLVCGAAGFIFRKRDRFWWIAAALIFYHVGLAFVAIGASRFRDPVDHILTVLAASLVVNWRSTWLELRTQRASIVRRSFALATILVLVVSAWCAVAFMKASRGPRWNAAAPSENGEATTK